MPREQINAEAN